MSEGARVWGLRRTPDAGGSLARHGIRWRHADFLNPSSLERLPPAGLVVLCPAPSRDSDDYFSAYVRGTQNILAALSGRASKLVLISSTGVYEIRDGSWVDEKVLPRPELQPDARSAEKARALLEAERLVLSSSFPAVVFRLAGIYGPGRNQIGLLKSGRRAPVLDGRYVNRIHVEDAVSGVETLVEKEPWGGIFLGVDDCPATRREFYAWLLPKLPFSPRGGTHASERSSKRCSNAKIKALGLTFRYPTFREGYAELLK